MKNSSLILFFLWVVLAILDFVALFCNVPMALGIAFNILNGTIVLGSIPMFIQEFRDRRNRKLAEKNRPEKDEEI